MTKRRHFAVTIGLALALGSGLAGCASGVDALPPKVAVPTDWANGGPDGAMQADLLPVAATEPSVPAEWWEEFGSRELARLIAEARRNNPDLSASARRIAQGTARARAAGAGLYPTLEGSGGGSRRWPGEGTARNSFQGGLDASYEIDLWGVNRANLDAAETLSLANAFDQAALSLSLDAEVATTYFQYLNLDDRLENARRILDIAERVLALVETQVRLGAASGLELAQQRGTVATLRANIPTLEQRRAETLNALAQLLGTTPGEVRIETAGLDGITLPTVAPGLPSELLARRPDIARAEAALSAARADLRAARAAMMPSIRLTGGGGYASDQLSTLFSPAGFLANLASGLAAPIFDGGRLSAQRDAAEAAADDAADAYRSAVIAAFRDVEDALAAAKYLAEIETAQRAALAEAERAYELAEIRYRAGSVDFLSLLEAQRSLFQQEDALEQTRLARLSAAVALYKALGGGWCEDGEGMACGAET